MYVSRYQNVSIMDFVGAKGYRGGGNNWSYKTCKASVKIVTTNKATPSFFYRPDAFPVAQPTVSKHWREQHQNLNLQIKLDYRFRQTAITFSLS